MSDDKKRKFIISNARNVTKVGTLRATKRVRIGGGGAGVTPGSEVGLERTEQAAGSHSDTPDSDDRTVDSTDDRGDVSITKIDKIQNVTLAEDVEAPEIDLGGGGEMSVPVEEKPSSAESRELVGFRSSVPVLSQLRKERDDSAEILFLEKIVELARSVGCVWSPWTTGTAFRVGTDLIMTCWHVIEGIQRHCEDFYNKEQIWVQFNYRPGDEDRPNETRFQLAALCYFNPDLDVAVLRLENNGNSLPPPIRRFGTANVGDKIQLVGHNKGLTKKLDPDCLVLQPTPEEIHSCEEGLRTLGWNESFLYQGMDNPSRVHFQCGFEKGASGSPGVIPGWAGLSVATMLARGYPDFFYSLPEARQRNTNIPVSFFMEEGVDMKAILEDIYNKKIEIYQDIIQ